MRSIAGITDRELPMAAKTTTTRVDGNPSFADNVWLSRPHAHHWRIAEAVGATSPGVCRICGMERLFDNWEKEPEPSQRALPNLEQRHAARSN